eukprot:s4300_g2.t1
MLSLQASGLKMQRPQAMLGWPRPATSTPRARHAKQRPASGFVLPAELGLARTFNASAAPAYALSTTPRTGPSGQRPQTVHAACSGKPLHEREFPTRFGLEPAGTAAAGDVIITRSSVRTYPGGPLTQCSVDREPKAPAHEFMTMFDGTAGLPSWHRKILSVSRGGT